MVTVVCCQMPGRSMNFRSTSLAPCFSAYLRTSLGVISILLSNGVVAFFSGADADHLVDGRHEDLAVADLTGARRLADGVEHLVHQRVGDDDLQLDLRDEVYDVGAAAIDLFLAAGAAETAHFRHGHSLHTDLGEGVLDGVELERLDDGFDFLHGAPSFELI